jgi:hypothetical protein
MLKRWVWNALVIVIRFLFILGWFVGDKVFTIEYFEACPKVTSSINNWTITLWNLNLLCKWVFESQPWEHNGKFDVTFIKAFAWLFFKTKEVLFQIEVFKLKLSLRKKKKKCLALIWECVNKGFRVFHGWLLYHIVFSLIGYILLSVSQTRIVRKFCSDIEISKAQDPKNIQQLASEVGIQRYEVCVII